MELEDGVHCHPQLRIFFRASSFGASWNEQGDTGDFGLGWGAISTGTWLVVVDKSVSLRPLCPVVAMVHSPLSHGHHVSNCEISSRFSLMPKPCPPPLLWP